VLQRNGTALCPASGRIGRWSRETGAVLTREQDGVRVTARTEVVARLLEALGA
jgi:hypothetical protein